MRYVETVYRPPSEAYSLIIQATIGCSQNGCHFCDMYKNKRFSIRPIEEVLEDLREARSMYSRIGRIFIADGDALICKTDYLLRMLSFIKDEIPECERVTSYASPRSVLVKSPEDLQKIREAGLQMLYLGLESGCEEVLSYMNKGASRDEIIKAGLMIKDAGYKLSVTVITGLGGSELTQAHAIDSASAVSAMKPDYLGALTLSILPGTVLYDRTQAGEFVPLSAEDALRESMMMIEHIDAEGCVFRSNHISNYVNVHGTFNAGRSEMIEQIRSALDANDYGRRRIARL